MLGNRTKNRRDKDDDSEVDSESIVIPVTFESRRDDGFHFMHVGQYKKAIESFTKALELNEGDKQCLVTRSKCSLQLGDAQNALKDAEMALLQGNDFIPAILRKAEALYQLGDFETALVYFHRGNKLRPELQEFLLGISKAQEAINNSIGSFNSVKLLAEGDLSLFERHQEEKNKKPHREGRRKMIQKVEEKKTRQRKVPSGDPKVTKKLLEELHIDKEYLEHLLLDKTLTNSKIDFNDETIRNLIIDELEYLDTRMNFWQQQKPLYSHRRKTTAKSAILRSGSKDILNRLEEVDDLLLQGNFRKALEKARGTLKIVEACPSNKVPEKNLFIANLHSCIGNAFMELGEFQLAENHHIKDQSISEENKQDKGRAVDNLGRTYARWGKNEEAIKIWETKLNSDLKGVEKAWLYHEIGRCYLELKKYAEALNYGQMSLAVAEEIEDEDWEMNAALLCAQSFACDKKVSSAVQHYQKVIDIAQKQGRVEVEGRIRKVMQELEFSESEGEEKLHKTSNGENEQNHEEKPSSDNGDYEDEFEEPSSENANDKETDDYNTEESKAGTPTNNDGIESNKDS
ncbi:repeat 25-like isoform X1 [Octopus vulgaris]|uniref:Outer dynein arm-docking complex subunit 4 n=1 Tax=Octopus vulgaris TaxID=6645 RepID=A0AA36ARS4_OCTVU|nr:repeat 25-like isoform X1 [Octopus vulgaris]